MAQAQLGINLTGSQTVTKIVFSENVDVDEKVEETVVLTSSSKTIDFSHINSPYLFIFKGDNEFIINITVGVNTISFKSESIFTCTLDPTFANTITTLSVEEANGTATSIEVRIYGESS